MSCSKEQFYSEILRLYTKYGRTDKHIYEQFAQAKVNYNYNCHKYGGIKQICADLGIPFVNIKQCKKEDVKNDFLRVYQQFGYITTELYLANGIYSKQAIKTAFGGVGKLMQEIGLNVNVRNETTKEDVIRDFQEYYNQTHCSFRKNFLANNKYSTALINRLFGTWSELLRQSGVEVNKDRYGIAQMLDQLRIVYMRRGFLNKPIIDHDCEFSYQAVRRYFHNTDEIEAAIGVKGAFKRLQSTPAKILESVLIELYGKDGVEKEKTWNWLVNHKSQRHMYVDFYIPSANLAFEYDGQQHFNECLFFKIDSVALSDYQYRDSLKNKLLNEHHIGLIHLNYTDSIDIETISKKIQQITNL